MTYLFDYKVIKFNLVDNNDRKVFASDLELKLLNYSSLDPINEIKSTYKNRLNLNDYKILLIECKNVSEYKSKPDKPLSTDLSWIKVGYVFEKKGNSKMKARVINITDYCFDLLNDDCSITKNIHWSVLANHYKIDNDLMYGQRVEYMKWLKGIK